MGLSECCRNFRNRLEVLHDRGSLASAIIFIVFQTLAGIGLLAISIWLYMDTSSYFASTPNDKFFVSIYILMAAGSLMTLVGFLGCCGAMQESSCMLGTFSTFVIIIFAAEIAGAVYGYTHQDQVKEAVSERVADMVNNGYKVQDAVTLAVDAMQKKLKCCGTKGPNDWADSVYNKGTRGSSFLDKLAYKVPASCCSLDNEDECNKLTSESKQTFITYGIYSDGCIKQLEQKIESHLFIIIAVGIGIAVVQIFGFVFSLVLCCAVSGDRY